MKAKIYIPTNKDELFRSHLNNIIDMKHPIVILSKKVNWQEIEDSFGSHFRSHRGRPALSTRLMAGLMIMQHSEGLSDGETVKLWCQNPYWQYFCGMEYFQHRVPIHPSSMVRWRKYVGEEGAKKLLSLSVQIAEQEGVVKSSDLERVNVDTTVQEKAITSPTDSKLYLTALTGLVKEAKANGLSLRQSYSRVAKNHHLKASRYAHARQFKRMRSELKLLRTKLGRVIREIERQSFNNPKLKERLNLCKRLHSQQVNDKNKIYSLHCPEVACISKGKAHKRYEFGSKVSIATTNKQGLIVGVENFQGNPYDGKTFEATLQTSEQITGRTITHAYVDKGYKGCSYKTVQIYRSGQRNLSRWFKKRLHARSHIEATIGHMKNEGKLGKNWLRGTEGDQMNAILCGVGQNVRLLLAAITFLPYFLAYLLEAFMKNQANTTSSKVMFT